MLQVKRSSILLTVLLAVGLVISSAALPAKVDPVTLPEGTPVHVRLDSTLSTKHARPGEPFAATVSQPVDVDGKTVIPQGAHVTGRVIEAKESGRFSGTPEMRLALAQVQVGGQSYALHTSSSFRKGRGHKKHNLLWIGGGAAGGAVIGAIAGAGEGALIGGPIGAAAGTAVVYFTGKKDLKLPAETPLTFKLKQPVTVESRG